MCVIGNKGVRRVRYWLFSFGLWEVVGGGGGTNDLMMVAISHSFFSVASLFAALSFSLSLSCFLFSCYFLVFFPLLLCDAVMSKYVG